MFYKNLYVKGGSYPNPFKNLYTQAITHGGEPPVITDKLLKEDTFSLLLETGKHILLEVGNLDD